MNKVDSPKSGMAGDYSPLVDGKARKRSRLGFITMISICIGLVIVQGSMLSALQGVGIGGAAFVAAVIIAFILSLFNAMTFSELSLMFPHAGTLGTYTEKAIGHFPAILAVYAGYVVVGVLGIPAEMFLVDAILNELLPGLFPPMLIPFVILIALTITNVLGTDVFAKAQNFFAFILVCALITIGLTAVTGIAEPYPVLENSALTWDLEKALSIDTIGLISLAMWMFVGVEFVCPMINEVKKPERDIPRAMILSLCIMLGIYTFFIWGASKYLTPETLTGTPIPYLDYANAVFGKAGLLFATVMAIAATCSTVNTVLASVSRMLQGMAENGQSFPQLKITSKRFGTPWVAIVFMSLMVSIFMMTMSIDFIIVLVISASTSWLLAYIIAHVDVIVLRIRYPELPRPYKSPFFPVPQLLGIIGMGYVAFNNSPTPELTQQIYITAGSILLVISIIAVLWVKLYMKKGLFTPE